MAVVPQIGSCHCFGESPFVRYIGKNICGLFLNCGKKSITLNAKLKKIAALKMQVLLINKNVQGFAGA
jgi:hypothetical protein